MNTADYLIVGQGLAGTLLAFNLLKKGKQIHVIDGVNKNTASNVAAGIINPVTGRRVVKSWMYEKLYPAAKQTYTELQDLLGGEYFHSKKIYRILFSAGEENKWLSKTALAEFAQYVVDPPLVPAFMDQVNAGFSAGEIHNAAQVDLPSLTKDFRHYLKTKNLFTEAFLDYEKLEFQDGKVKYGNCIYNKVIFCEGHATRFNPWFSYLPFEVAKGEVLLIQSKELKALADSGQLLKHKLFIVPLQGDLFWVGSTYDWDPKDELPSQEKRTQLEEGLAKILNCDYQIVDQKAAIRPAIKDRRPVFGLHPEKSELAVFNGFGTKGASIGPYWAIEFLEYLESGGDLPEEVNISRYNDLFSSKEPV